MAVIWKVGLRARVEKAAHGSMVAVCAVIVLSDTDKGLHCSYCSPVPLKNADVMFRDACLCVSGMFTWQERRSLNPAAGRGGGRQPQLVGLHSLVPFAGSRLS